MSISLLGFSHTVQRLQINLNLFISHLSTGIHLSPSDWPVGVRFTKEKTDIKEMPDQISTDIHGQVESVIE